MRVKMQQLEPCIEQLIGLGLIKEYDRAVCCHPVYLTCQICLYHPMKLEVQRLEMLLF